MSESSDVRKRSSGKARRHPWEASGPSQPFFLSHAAGGLLIEKKPGLSVLVDRLKTSWGPLAGSCALAMSESMQSSELLGLVVVFSE